MQVEFLGTAGYHPSEERHTSCVWVPDAAPGAGFVLDAGTGFFRLAHKPLPARLHIFLSHAHLDHTAGLTYLLDVLYGRECRITLYGASGALHAVRHDLFDSPLFPLPFSHAMQEVQADSAFEVEGVRVRACDLTHPGGSFGYRFDWPQTAEAGPPKSLAYITDTSGDARYLDFVSGVDLLIHERNFSDDLHQVADASGHCTSQAVARVARAANVKQLALTHFNPLPQIDPASQDELSAEFPSAIFARDNLSLTL